LIADLRLNARLNIKSTETRVYEQSWSNDVGESRRGADVFAFWQSRMDHGHRHGQSGPHVREKNEVLNGKCASENVIRQGCTDVIVADIGDGALGHLQAAHIRTWAAPEPVTGNEALRMLREGQLPPVPAARAATRHGEAHGCCCANRAVSEASSLLPRLILKLGELTMMMLQLAYRTLERMTAPFAWFEKEISVKMMRYLIALLALAGVVVSALALRVHYSTETQPCSINEKWDCGVVNHSPYSEIAHIPVAAIGIAGYLALAVLALARQRFLVLLAALVGLGFALRLTSIEEFALCAWCIYCVISQAVIALITLLALGWFTEEYIALKRAANKM
jgi:vitamin-K-epoxide reductase (warfarin-sensitive)